MEKANLNENPNTNFTSLNCLLENVSQQLISSWRITTRNKSKSRNNNTAIRDRSHYLTQNLQDEFLNPLMSGGNKKFTHTSALVSAVATNFQ